MASVVATSPSVYTMPRVFGPFPTLSGKQVSGNMLYSSAWEWIFSSPVLAKQWSSDLGSPQTGFGCEPAAGPTDKRAWLPWPRSAAEANGTEFNLLPTWDVPKNRRKTRDFLTSYPHSCLSLGCYPSSAPPLPPSPPLPLAALPPPLPHPALPFPVALALGIGLPQFPDTIFSTPEINSCFLCRDCFSAWKSVVSTLS